MGRLRGPASSILVPLGLTIALTVVAFWIAERFTLEGRLRDRFADIVMDVPMGSGLRQPPMDVSASVCQQIDDELRRELSSRTRVEVGWGFNVRLLIIDIGARGQCSASVNPGLAF